MTSVRTPAACAWAMIARALPPSERLRYQIHTERPRMGISEAVAVAGHDHARAHGSRAVTSNKTAVVAFLGRPSDTAPCRCAGLQLLTLGEPSAVTTRASPFADPGGPISLVQRSGRKRHWASRVAFTAPRCGEFLRRHMAYTARTPAHIQS